MNWATVIVCAVVIAYTDGYWVTSLRGAVGAIEGNQRPFTRWLRDSTLMLPLVLMAVLAALTLTRRWLGRSRHEIAQVGTAALLIIVISSAVSIAGVATTSVYDYNIQAANLGQIHSSHVTSVAVDPGVSKPSTDATSGALDAAKHATLMAHVRAVGDASVVLLITNLVLVAWALALRGGRLWASQPAAVALGDDPTDKPQ